ncbi:MAG TPA: hypothetical protein VIP30_12185 [Stenotrophomonas sp.]
MSAPPPAQMIRLRRIRLLRAQRNWRQLLDARGQLRQALSALTREYEAQQAAGRQCLRHAEAGAARYTLVMRRACAHQTQAASLGRQAQALAKQLDEMTPQLRSARVALEKARRLLEESSPR